MNFQNNKINADMEQATVQQRAKDNILAMCREIWTDFKTGKIDYERLMLHVYTKKHSVQKFPKKFIAPVLVRKTEPTEADAEELRLEINHYVYGRRGKAGLETAKLEAMDEKMAIAVLKKKGYRVMKKTMAYIDL